MLGKALGAGFPVAALAGKAALMALLGDGSVMHGGTYRQCHGHRRRPTPWTHSPAPGAAPTCASPRWPGCWSKASSGCPKTRRSLAVQGVGAVLNTTFDPPGPVTDYRSYQLSNLTKQLAFITALDAEGVRVTGRGTWFVSTADTEADVELTLDAAAEALRRIS